MGPGDHPVGADEQWLLLAGALSEEIPYPVEVGLLEVASENEESFFAAVFERAENRLSCCFRGSGSGIGGALLRLVGGGVLKRQRRDESGGGSGPAAGCGRVGGGGAW